MSSFTKLPYRQVMPIAEKVLARLAPACARIEIAGSLRRKAVMIGDIELVAVPRFEKPVMGMTPRDRWDWSQVDHLLCSLDQDNKIDILKGDKLRGKQRKYVQFTLVASSGQPYTVDLFLQPDPRTWGVNLLIRTGSSEFSKRMVTSKAYGGWMPDGWWTKDALLYNGDELVPTPEEADVFEAISKDYVEPEGRS